MFRKLSLKARLHAATLVLVMSLVFVLAGLNLHRSLSQTFLDVQERSLTNAAQIRDFLLQRIEDRVLVHRPRPSTLEESKELWTSILRDDPLIPQLLQKALANSRLVADILITDAGGLVLTAPNVAHAGGRAPHLPDYLAWQKRPLPDKVWEIFTRNQDYVITIPLGAVGDAAGEEVQGEKPLFTIRVLISSLLLKEAIRPELESIFYISLAAIGISLLYAFLFSNLMLRPLGGISRAIDRISAGEFSSDPLRPDAESREFADLQSKLGLLGKQVRGARQDALHLRSNIDQLLERMEEVVLLFDEHEYLVMAGVPAERFFRRKREELLGRGLAELFPDSSPIGGHIRAALQFHKSLSGLVVRHKRPGGEEGNYLLSLDYTAGQTLITLRDAESRNALALHLDLSSRLASISRLTSGVAHEIKNPLNAIAIHLEILRSQLEHSEVESKAELDIIAREIARLDRVVKTFLNFTRPVEVRIARVELGAMLVEISRLVRTQAAANHVEVNVLKPGHEVHAWADPDLLQQALLNIIVNGIESMPDGGPLFLRLLETQQEAAIEIEDKGGGVPEELQEKIFQLYFTTKEKGSGIGLAVAFQSVQLMSGQLSMRSAPGEGTQFRIGLRNAGAKPVEPAASAEANGEEATAPGEKAADLSDSVTVRGLS
jgi:signal transduction histidine kinase